jgi:acylphosphatase
MASARVVVKGRVQGVGFRYFVAQLAERHGVRGEVWNRRDGAVEAILEHEDPAVLDDMVTDLSTGPGRVEAIDRSDAAPEGFEGFSIVRQP